VTNYLDGGVIQWVERLVEAEWHSGLVESYPVEDDGRRVQGKFIKACACSESLGSIPRVLFVRLPSVGKILIKTPASKSQQADIHRVCLLSARLAILANGTHHVQATSLFLWNSSDQH
jgi:hypothetical protein